MKIQLTNLSKSYGQQKVLSSISFTFSGPGLYIIYGNSGSGKTTLLNILANIENYDSGTLNFDLGSKVNGGLIFQHNYLLGHLTVLDNIMLPLNIKKMKADEFYLTQLLDKLDISKLKTRKVKTLSGGEAQRTNIVRTLMMKPNYLLADEPTGSVDAFSAQKIKSLLIEVSLSKIVIVVSHDRKLFAGTNATFLEMQGGQLSENKLEN